MRGISWPSLGHYHMAAPATFSTLWTIVKSFSPRRYVVASDNGACYVAWGVCPPAARGSSTRASPSRWSSLSSSFAPGLYMSPECGSIQMAPGCCKLPGIYLIQKMDFFETRHT